MRRKLLLAFLIGTAFGYSLNFLIWYLIYVLGACR